MPSIIPRPEIFNIIEDDESLRNVSNKKGGLNEYCNVFE